MILGQIILGINTIILAYLCYITYKRKEKEQKESEFYTDYVKGTYVMRVYKTEFEFEAIGKVPRDRLLDFGNLTMNYKWALIDFSKDE